jgi:hypothetical protein
VELARKVRRQRRILFIILATIQHPRSCIAFRLLIFGTEEIYERVPEFGDPVHALDAITHPLYSPIISSQTTNPPLRSFVKQAPIRFLMMT